MALDWNSPAMCTWKEEAVKTQLGFFYLFGEYNWREYKPSDYNILKRIIGFAMFGDAKNKGDENLNGGTGYTYKQFEIINTTFEIIKKYNNKKKDQEKIWVSFLFVLGKAGDESMTFPVFRIPEYDVTVQQYENIFIDSSGRVYKNWEDYLKNNKLPDCVICYPKSGVYSKRDGILEVEFRILPAGKDGRQNLGVLDTGKTIVKVGVAVVEVVKVFFPVASPVVEGASAVSMVVGGLSASQNIWTLVDRFQHQQIIGLGNAESRNCWLGIASFLLSLVSRYAGNDLEKIVQTGNSIALKTKICVSVASCIVNALGVCSTIGDIMNKFENEEDITDLYKFQLISLVLFFANIFISVYEVAYLIDSIRKNSKRKGSHDKEPLRKKKQLSL